MIAKIILFLKRLFCRHPYLTWKEMPYGGILCCGKCGKPLSYSVDFGLGIENLDPVTTPFLSGVSATNPKVEWVEDAGRKEIK